MLSILTQVLDKPSEFDFGYHSLDRTSIEGSTDSPRTLHTVEEDVHENNDSSRDETQSLDHATGTKDVNYVSLYFFRSKSQFSK